MTGTSHTHDSWQKSRLPMKWAVGWQTQGLAPIQEDYFEINSKRGIFLLADGFGGSAGARASQQVVKSVHRFLEQEAGDLDATLPFELRTYFSLAGNVLFNSVSYANQKLLAANEKKSALVAGGASLIGGYLEGNLLSIANVGACSAHLYRNGKSKEIVAPKSLARQMNPFDESTDEAIPLMSFGTAKGLEPEILEIEIQPGDQICFHTVGFSKEARDQIFDWGGELDLNQVFSDFSPQFNGSVIWVGF